MENQIKEILFKVVEEINENLAEDQQLELSTETVLLGKDGNIDSITLVNLIVTIEESIEDELNVEITLADEKALSQKESPFRTIGTLIDYIAQVVKD
jgi:acyl carrier protein